MIKKVFLSILVAVCSMLCINVSAQDTDTLFPYPTLPEDTNMSLSQRCNYLVYNFWDHANIKQSFSSMTKLDKAFGTWLSFMPYATADTVHLAIDNFLAVVEKQAPKNMIDVAKMAERWLYSDSAAFQSEEIYEPFLAAVVKNKKAPKAEKARYQAQYTVLQSSGLGKIVPRFDIVTPGDSIVNFGDVMASRVIIFFNDPECFDCNLIKVRLSADYNLNQLIDRGLIKVVSIYPGEATDEWKQEASKYPANWVVGAAPDIDLYFNLGDLPVLYYLDGRHKVLGKDVDIDNMLYAVREIYNQQNR